MASITESNSNTPNPKGRGQGLVEMALIAPILIFMLIGLFEVGYILWGYMTLLNIDREATRFATVAGALDYEIPAPTDVAEEIGYNKIIEHALLSNAGQLNLEEYLANTENNVPNAPKAAIIITHIVADTRSPCDADSDPNCYKTNCSASDYTDDDLVVHPADPGYSHFRYSYPEGQTVFQSQWPGQADLEDKSNQLKEENNNFNCNLWNRTGISDFSDFSGNSVIIMEMYYELPQLLSFPLFAWIANPYPLKVQTTMRIEAEMQPLCELYPIATSRNIIQSAAGGAVNLLQPPPNGNNYGWLTWNPGAGKSLEDEFKNPRLAINDYRDPVDGDTKLNGGDRIAGLTGLNNTSAINAALANLAGQEILIPVYGSKSGGYYRVHASEGFAKVKIINFDLSNSEVMATVIDYPVTWACPGDGS